MPNSKINKLIRQRFNQPTAVGGRSKVLERNKAFSTIFGVKQHRSTADQQRLDETRAKKLAAAEEKKKIDEVIARKRAEIAIAKEAQKKAKLATNIRDQTWRPKPPVKRQAMVQKAKGQPTWRLIPVDIPKKDKKYEHFLGYKGSFADVSTPRCRNCRELMFYEVHKCRHF